jgi:hypothetical protein
MRLGDLTAEEVAAAYDRLDAYVDARLCYHPGGSLGRACGSPLGVMAAAAHPELRNAPVDARAAAAALGLAVDVFMSFFGGFSDACDGVPPSFDRWPRNEFTDAYRAGFRIAGELRRLRPDLCARQGESSGASNRLEG